MKNKTCKLCLHEQPLSSFKVDEVTKLPHSFCDMCRGSLRLIHNSKRDYYFRK